MAHQITLNDDDYAALVKAANAKGTSVEEELHQVIVDLTASSAEIEDSIEYPSGEADDAQKRIRDREIAARLSSDKPWLSEMIIEDRGPR